MRVYVAVLVLLAGLIVPLSSQVTVPNTFTANTRINSADVNANFAELSKALNRTGGTMTGTLTSQQITPSATATYDLGVTGTRFRDLWLSRDATIGGSGGVTALTVVSPAAGTNLALHGRSSDDLSQVAFFANNGTTRTGLVHSDPTNGVRFYTGASSVLAITLSPAGDTAVAGAVFETGVITPSTITADQNDYAPAGFATAKVVRLTHNNTGASRSITGLAGGASGRRVTLCNVNGSSAESLVLISESASSSAANRFGTQGATIGGGLCVDVWYDGTSNRWRVIP